MRRIFTTLLFSATLLSCLVSCGGKPSDPNMINYIGRYQTETINGKEVTTFSYTASGFEFKVNVTSDNFKLGLNLFSQTFDGFVEQYINVYVDDLLIEKVKLDKSENLVSVSNLSLGEHVIRINKLNEAQFSKMGLIDYVLENVEIVEISKRNKKIVEFYGDSITCGYGNLATQREGFSMLTEDGMQSYGQLTADHLNWDSSIIGYSGIALAMSPFNSPYTLMDKYNTVDGYKPWDFSINIPDVVVINIGTNDNTYYRGLSGTAQEEATNLFLNNYKTLMKNIKTYYPDVKIVCVSNMMVELNGFLNMCMQGAVQQLNNEYGEFSYYLEFLPNNQGADGHPGLSAHISNAETLANFISTII